MYSQLEKAKMLMNIPEGDQKYGTQLFLALRITGSPLKESIQILQSLKLKVNFKDFFEVSILGENQDIISPDEVEDIKEMGQEIIEEIEEKIPLPKTNLMNMLFIEALKFHKGSDKRRGATSTDSFVANLKSVKSELFNLAGG